MGLRQKLISSGKESTKSTFLNRKQYIFSERSHGVENSDRPVIKKKAAGCQDEGYQKFLFVRAVIFSTFRANSVGKVQSFDQGSITEKKGDYWMYTVNIEYTIE